jgi:hypothetical protein
VSHTTVLKTIQIRSISALKEAVEYLKAQGVNCEIVENAKPRMYYANQYETCDYVLKLKDCVYDVGFAKQADGTYVPVFDSWDNAIQKQIGLPSSCKMPTTTEEKQAAAVSRLLDCYAVHAAKEELTNSGEYYSFEVGYEKSDGSYTLEATQSY